MEETHVEARLRACVAAASAACADASAGEDKAARRREVCEAAAQAAWAALYAAPPTGRDAALRHASAARL